MDMVMDIPVPDAASDLEPPCKPADEMLCAYCFALCGLLSGYGGRWQNIKGTSGTKWVYLCRGCDHALWRVFSKLEKFADKKQMNAEWNAFLAEEFKHK